MNLKSHMNRLTIQFHWAVIIQILTILCREFFSIIIAFYSLFRPEKGRYQGKMCVGMPIHLFAKTQERAAQRDSMKDENSSMNKHRR